MLRKLRRLLSRNNTGKSVATRRKMQFESLEPRILLSADLPGEQLVVMPQLHEHLPAIEQTLDVGNDSLERPSVHSLLNSAVQQPVEIVIIDSSVDDSQSLLDELQQNEKEGTRYEYYVLDANADGVSQISDILADRQDINAVHLFSHGDEGKLSLGNTLLAADNLADYAEQLASWGESLDEQGDILLYGCNVGAGESGADFVTTLAELTGADVAASDDATGALTLGGDSILETVSGTIETPVLDLDNYSHLLEEITGSNVADTLLIDDSGASDDGIMRYSLDSGVNWTDFSLLDDLVIDLGAGDDSVVIQGFDNNFSGSFSIMGGSGTDSIIISEDVDILASQITFEAENISINTGATLDATVAGSGDGSLVLTAQADGSGLLGSALSDLASGVFGDDGVGQVIADYVDEVGLPFDYVPAQTAITITGATLIGGSVNVTATSTIDEQEFDIPFSLKVLVENAQADVTVTDSNITATSGDLTLSATASVTANNSAESLGTPLVDAAGSVTMVISEAHTIVTDSTLSASDGNVDLLAANSTSITTVADGTVGGMTQAGGVAAVAVVVTDTEAALEGTFQVSDSNSLEIKATSNNTLTTTAVSTPGGSDGDGGLLGSLLGTGSMSTGTSNPLSVAGSVAVSVLTQTTDAHITGAGGSITSSGEVSVATESASAVTTLADASSTNTPSANIGGGIAGASNIIVTSNKAYLSGDVDFVDATGVTVSGGMADDTTHSSSVTAISGASSGVFGGAGAFALNVSTNSTLASVLAGSDLDLGGADLTLETENVTSNSVTATGTQSATAGFGVGGSLAANIVINDSIAEIAGDASLANLGGLSLTALGAHTQSTTAEAGAGGDAAVSPAIALGVGVNETAALLSAGEALALTGGLVLSATHSSSQTTKGQADAAGESAGFGIGFGLTVDVENSTARLDRSVTSSSGDATISATSLVDVVTSSTASSAGESSAGDANGDTTADSQVSEQMNVATGRSELSGSTLPSTPTATTSSGNLSVAGALAVNAAISNSTAVVTQGTTLTLEDGSASVTASNDTDASVTADASAVGSGNASIAPITGVTTDSSVTSGLALTFSDNANADCRDTLTRSTGSWLNDGFVAGDTITISGGSDTLNGTYTIAAISSDGLTLTLTESAELSTENVADASSLTVTRNDGIAVSLSDGLTASDNIANSYDTLSRSSGTWSYVAGDTITIAGTGSNNSTVTVASVSSDGKTLTFTSNAALTTEQVISGTVTLTRDGTATALACSGVGLTFQSNADGVDSILLTGASWVAKGYAVGDTITISNSASNDGNYTVSAISTDGTILYLSEADSLSAETAVAGVNVARLIAGQLNGDVQLTFADVGDSGDTITRSSGSWVDDGFAVGDAINVSGSSANNNSYVIAAISADGSTLTLANGYFLNNENNASAVQVTLISHAENASYSGPFDEDLELVHDAGDNDTIVRYDTGSWINDGFAVGDSIAVTTNDGTVKTYTVTGVSEVTLTLSGSDDVSGLTVTDIASIKRGSSETSSSNAGIGVGVAGAINVATVSNTATVAGSIVADGVNIAATMDSRDAADAQHSLSATAISGAGASNVGVAGSLATNIGVTNSNASVTATGSLDAGDDENSGDISLEAENTSNVTVTATSSQTNSSSSTGTTTTSTSKSVGAGASVALNVGVNTATAEIDGAAAVLHANDLSLTASGDHSAVTTAEAGSSGSVSGSGAVALNVGVNTTSANLPDGSALDIAGDLTLQADHSGSATTIGSADTDSSSVGFAIGLGLNVEVDKATAVLDRDVTSASGDVTIHAHTLSNTIASSTAGVNGADPASSPDGTATDSSAQDQIDKEMNFATGQSALDGVETPALDGDATQTSDGGVSIGAALAVNVAVSESTAEITEDTILATGGSLTLSAANDSDASASANASAVGKGSVTTTTTNTLPPTAVTGGVTLTFTDNAAAADPRDTISRSIGSWSTDGFAVGDTIVVSGSGSYDGTYSIAEISADGTTLYLTAASTDIATTGTASGSGLLVKTQVTAGGNRCQPGRWT